MKPPSIKGWRLILVSVFLSGAKWSSMSYVKKKVSPPHPPSYVMRRWMVRKLRAKPEVVSLNPYNRALTRDLWLVMMRMRGHWQFIIFVSFFGGIFISTGCCNQYLNDPTFSTEGVVPISSVIHWVPKVRFWSTQSARYERLIVRCDWLSFTKMFITVELRMCIYGMSVCMSISIYVLNIIF